MREVGAYEAKTRLAELLDAVLAGETITISRHGQPVAVMMPIPSRRQMPPDQVIARLRQRRRQARLDGISLSALIAEGRK
jgi:prevent-host-death family protein